MELASSDTSCVFQTEHGHVHRHPDHDRLRIEWSSRTLDVQRSRLSLLKEAARTLADSVERCPNGCRWQFRAPALQRPFVLVLSSGEVLQLAELLDGAATMLELEAMLSEAEIDWA